MIAVDENVWDCALPSQFLKPYLNILTFLHLIQFDKLCFKPFLFKQIFCHLAMMAVGLGEDNYLEVSYDPYDIFRNRVSYLCSVDLIDSRSRLSFLFSHALVVMDVGQTAIVNGRRSIREQNLVGNRDESEVN